VEVSNPVMALSRYRLEGGIFRKKSHSYLSKLIINLDHQRLLGKNFEINA
jgi:hypothetical protein